MRLAPSSICHMVLRIGLCEMVLSATTVLSFLWTLLSLSGTVCLHLSSSPLMGTPTTATTPTPVGIGSVPGACPEVGACHLLVTAMLMLASSLKKGSHASPVSLSFPCSSPHHQQEELPCNCSPRFHPASQHPFSLRQEATLGIWAERPGKVLLAYKLNDTTSLFKILIRKTRLMSTPTS